MAAEIEDEVLALSIEGYLFKQGGGNRKKWQKRYFELVEGNLLYYKSEEKMKLKGTIYLTEGWGVRSKKECTCNWPPGLRPSRCFGLATKDRTFYFYSSDEGIEEWTEYLQAVINVIGDPCDDTSNDHDGKPAGKKSKIAKAAATVGAKAAVTLGTKAAKVAVQYAGVDDTIQDLVSTGADAVNNAVKGLTSEDNEKKSSSKRVNTGTIPVPSSTYHKSEIVNEDESEAHGMARGLTKGLGSSAFKKTVINPPGVKDLQKKSEEVLEGNEKIENMMEIASGRSKSLPKLSAPSEKIVKGKGLGVEEVKEEGKDVARGLAKGFGSAIKKKPLKPPQGSGGSTFDDDPQSLIKSKSKISEDMKDFDKVKGGAKKMGKLTGKLGKSAKNAKGIGDLKEKKSLKDNFTSKATKNVMAKKAGAAALKTSAKTVRKGLHKGATSKWGHTAQNDEVAEEDEYQDEEMESFEYGSEENGEDTEENVYDVLY